jgi:hypothetical protein
MGGNLTSGTIVVTGLTVVTAYTFTVTAKNAVGTSAASAPSASVTTGYAVGSTGPGGGKVFYVSNGAFQSTGSACGTTCRYLEAQTTDVATVRWCTWTNKLVGGTFGTAIGTGFSNTQLMTSPTNTNYCGTGAAVSAKATSGGYSDWYLPSKDELYALYQQRATAGGFVTGNYWSSSQVSATNVWFLPFGGSFSGVPNNLNKSSLYKVRPVRAF